MARGRSRSPRGPRGYYGPRGQTPDGPRGRSQTRSRSPSPRDDRRRRSPRRPNRWDVIHGLLQTVDRLSRSHQWDTIQALLQTVDRLSHSRQPPSYDSWDSDESRGRHSPSRRHSHSRSLSPACRSDQQQQQQQQQQGGEPLAGRISFPQETHPHGYRGTTPRGQRRSVHGLQDHELTMNELARRESNRARRQRQRRYRPNPQARQQAQQAQAPAQGNNSRADPTTAEAPPRPMADIIREVVDEMLQDMELDQ